MYNEPLEQDKPTRRIELVLSYGGSLSIRPTPRPAANFSELLLSANSSLIFALIFTPYANFFFVASICKNLFELVFRFL